MRPAAAPAEPSPTPLRVGGVFRFWLPLLGTWMMMAFEGPFLTAVIARLPEPTVGLAAYGVAFALAIIVESPVIMLMSASTQLVRDRDSLRAMQNFTWRLNLAVSVAMLLLLLPPLWSLVGDRILHLPPEVSRATHVALLWLLPWPAAIGDRRFHQGILIRAGQTWRVGVGTMFRLCGMAVAATLLASFGSRSGAEIGAMALTAGVLSEAIAVRVMSRSAIRTLREREAAEGRGALRLGRIWAFYAPLALTMVLSMAIQPLVTLFLGHSRMALQSLAVLPVINALTFLFRAWGLSFQEVAIAKLGESTANYPLLRRFAIWISLGALAGMALIVWTPLAGWWFGRVSGLEAGLLDFARGPARLAVLLPGLSAVLSMQRALLVHAERTGPLGSATIAELLTIALCLGVGILGFDLIGAYVAITAMLTGRLVSCAILLPPSLRSVRRLRGAVSTAALLLAIAGSALARDWFVAAGAEAGDGSSQNPYGAYEAAAQQAVVGDRILLGPGVYTQTTPLTVNGQQRHAAMILRDGVEVIGAGPQQTILFASATTFYAITAEGVASGTRVADLSVEGAFVQGVNLRGASPRFERIELRNDAVGGSGVAIDVRDRSFPELDDCVFDGGHSAVFVEFSSGGIFRRCLLGSRVNETLVIIGSDPRFEDCEIRSGGRDTIVLAQNSQPQLARCRIADGTRWTVRVCCYAADSTIDLSGNVWSSDDAGLLQARILDARDDPSLGGRVELLPFHVPVTTPSRSFGELRARFSGGS